MTMSVSLSSYLANQQIHYDILEHVHTDNSLATAEAAHVAPQQVAKAVVVKHNNHYTMCVLPASHQLILEWLEYEQQLAYELADEQELRRLFPDCELGAIPCIGQAFDMDVIVDTALMENKDVYIEGGDHRQLVHVSNRDFQAMMGDAWQAVISCPKEQEFEDRLH